MQNADEVGRIVAPGTLRLERLLPGPIERVWAYLVEPDKRAKWFAGGRMERKPGGKLQLLFKHSNLTDEPAPERFQAAAAGVESPGVILRFEPPHVLAFTWGEGADESEVTFELTPQGDSVLLVLTHSRLPSREEMVNVGSGWHLHLLVLDDLLRERPRRPFWSTQAQLEQRYDEQLPR
jgi:uncharacterized protein YndB with AHSA1/START domain